MAQSKQVVTEKKGEHAYMMRVEMRVPWKVIALELNYATHRGAITAAKSYADKHKLPWPLRGYSKGKALYISRSYGLSWRKLANQFNQTTDQVRRSAYKYAARYNLPWPPTRRFNHEQIHQGNSSHKEQT